MRYDRMPIEIEAPEEYGYENIRYNLSESSFTDQTLESLDLKIPNLKLIYNEHRGGKKLRKLVASGGDSLHEDDVLITSGAAGALFIISTSQLNPESHLVVVRPNYSTNIETPRAIGCEISFIDLTYEDQFQINVAAIEAHLGGFSASACCRHQKAQLPSFGRRNLSGYQLWLSVAHRRIFR